MRRSRSVARRVARKTAKVARRSRVARRRSRVASRLRTAKRSAKRRSRVARRSIRRASKKVSRRRVSRNNRNRRILRGGMGAFPIPFDIEVIEGKIEIYDHLNYLKDMQREELAGSPLRQPGSLGKYVKQKLATATGEKLRKMRKPLVMHVGVATSKTGRKGGFPVRLTYNIRQHDEPGESAEVEYIGRDTVSDNYKFNCPLPGKLTGPAINIELKCPDPVFEMLTVGDNGLRGEENPVFKRYYYSKPLDDTMQAELKDKGVHLTADMITPGGKGRSDAAYAYNPFTAEGTARRIMQREKAETRLQRAAATTMRRQAEADAMATEIATGAASAEASASAQEAPQPYKMDALEDEV